MIEVLHGVGISTAGSSFLNFLLLKRLQILHELTAGQQLSFPGGGLSQLGQKSELVIMSWDMLSASWSSCEIHRHNIGWWGIWILEQDCGVRRSCQVHLWYLTFGHSFSLTGTATGNATSRFEQLVRLMTQQTKNQQNEILLPNMHYLEHTGLGGKSVGFSLQHQICQAWVY